MSLINYGALTRSLYFSLPSSASDPKASQSIFGVEINDCAGLILGNKAEEAIYLRTPGEMRAMAEWLRTLWFDPRQLLAVGISPEFADESVPNVWDATTLDIECYKSKGRKPKLYLGTIDCHNAAAILFSFEATLGLAKAIDELARQSELSIITKLQRDLIANGTAENAAPWKP